MDLDSEKSRTDASDTHVTHTCSDMFKHVMRTFCAPREKMKEQPLTSSSCLLRGFDFVVAVSGVLLGVGA